MIADGPWAHPEVRRDLLVGLRHEALDITTGIEHELPLPPETKGNGYEANGEPLPASLREATARLSESKQARELLGETFVDHYVRTREWECRQFESAVTKWELERYFEII